MSEYSIALSRQLDALRWLQSPSGRALAVEMAKHDPRNMSVEDIGGVLARGIALGDPFYCSDEVCGLIEFAARSLDDWTYDQTMLLTENGFAYFRRPLKLPGTQQRDLTAISWSTIYELEDGPKGAIVQLPPGHLPYPRAMNAVFHVREPFAEFVPVTNIFLRFGQSANDAMAVANKYNEVTDRERWLTKFRLLGAFLLFIQQRVFVAQAERADRATRRQCGEFRPEGIVRVVRLRKAKNAGHTPNDDPQEWTCRWMVRGHWRQQWYPTLKRHQPKWITPYVKGPEDMPLKQPRATVFAVVR